MKADRVLPIPVQVQKQTVELAKRLASGDAQERAAAFRDTAVSGNATIFTVVQLLVGRLVRREACDNTPVIESLGWFGPVALDALQEAIGRLLITRGRPLESDLLERLVAGVRAVAPWITDPRRIERTNLLLWTAATAQSP